MGMFDFIGDLFGGNDSNPGLIGGALGQQVLPGLNTVAPGQYMSTLAQYAPQAANINLDYNKILGPGYANLYNQVEDIYDPKQRALRSATTNSILDELNLGGSLSPETVKQVQQKSLQTSGASGFRGGSPIGLGLVARDLGQTMEDLRNKRQAMAAGYVRSAPKGNQIFQAESVANPADAANLLVGNSNQQNAYNTFASELGAKNAQNAAGGLFDLGGMISGVFSGNNNPFTSILKGAGGILGFL